MLADLVQLNACGTDSSLAELAASLGDAPSLHAMQAWEASAATGLLL